MLDVKIARTLAVAAIVSEACEEISLCLPICVETLFSILFVERPRSTVNASHTSRRSEFVSIPTLTSPGILCGPLEAEERNVGRVVREGFFEFIQPLAKFLHHPWILFLFGALDTSGNCSTAWRRRIRIVCEGAHYRGPGRNVSWEGTASFEGARIERIAPVDFWNVEQLPKQVAADEIAWRCVATGGFSAIDVWLDEIEHGVLRLCTSEIDADLELAGIDLADTRIDAGGLYKAVRVFRLPDENATRSMTVSRRVKRRQDADTRLYACVTLENGH